MSNRASSDKNFSTLLLITNHFPYGLAEAFLEHEIDYLVKGFNQVIIVSKDVISDSHRVIHPSHISYRINPQSSRSEKLLTILLYLKHLRKAISFLKEEINFLRSIRKRISLAICQNMIHDLTKAITLSHHLTKIINKHAEHGTVTLYSYWLTSSALATLFVRGKSHLNIKRFSRAHGGDIYDYRNNLSYLSFRSALFKHLDRIYCISQSGKHYLQQALNTTDSNKLSVSRLGIRSTGNLPIKKDQSFLIVSCSFLLPVKQVHLIIESLAHIQKFDLTWIHIGDGPLRKELEEMATVKLAQKKNIRYQFKGSITNVELFRFYSEKFVDLFINTSSSEGIPVTMMEAQSKGIPVIAFDVGGIKEIVTNTNGKLLPSDSSPEAIARAIEQIQSLDEMEYKLLRANAFESWKNNYDADRNFSTFVAEILTL